MPIEVVVYTEHRRGEWDAFVESSINGTFLHKRTFFDCNPLNLSDDHSLMFFASKKLVALLPANLRSIDSLKTLVSHGRATYGGFVFNRDVGVEESVEIVASLISYLGSIGVDNAIVRNPFRFLYEQISDEFEYAMWYHGFSVMSRELEVFIDLAPGVDAVRARYQKATRNNNTRAHKDVEVRINDYSHLENFWKLLDINLADRHAKKPVHSFDEIQVMIDTLGQSNFAFAVGLHNEQLIGGCFMFVPRPNVLHAQYIAQDYQMQNLRPVNAIIDEVVSWGCSMHYKGFNLGTANEGGRIYNKGLFHFKEGFGGRSVLRETHQLIIEAKGD